MASYIGNIKAGGTAYPVGSTLYGTCSTAAGTAAKVVTMANFDTLLTGVTIHVKFDAANSVANPTLKVGSTDAKAIMRYGTTRPSTSANTSWNAGSVVSFTYDGTYWQMNGWLDSNTTTGTTYAATSVPANTTFATNGSVKNVYDATKNQIILGQYEDATYSKMTNGEVPKVLSYNYVDVSHYYTGNDTNEAYFMNPLAIMTEEVNGAIDAPPIIIVDTNNIWSTLDDPERVSEYFFEPQTKSFKYIYAGTNDMTPGTTALGTGIIYLQYEA